MVINNLFTNFGKQIWCEQVPQNK